MLAQQRQREILRRLTALGGARVADLARKLRVTEETIRRDLEKLGREGKLIRTHGGAVPLESGSRDLPFEARKSANHEAKVAIALRALREIEPGDIVALDASSTVYELARLLPDEPLTVVTNSLPVTGALARRQQIRVITTGGQLDHASQSWTGPLAEQTLDNVNFAKVFVSAKGVSLRWGLSEVDDAQARIKRRMIERTLHPWVLVDHSKFERQAAVHLLGWDDAFALMTDAATPPEIVAELRRREKVTVVAE